MWPLAGCISSVLVQTPSLQLGVLQIPTRFILSQSDPLVPPCSLIPLVEARATTHESTTTYHTAQVGHKGVNPFHCVQTKV